MFKSIRILLAGLAIGSMVNAGGETIKAAVELVSMDAVKQAAQPMSSLLVETFNRNPMICTLVALGATWGALDFHEKVYTPYIKPYVKNVPVVAMGIATAAIYGGMFTWLTKAPAGK